MKETQPRPFDERAALDELERLAEKIQSTRRQRERAVAEFNAFVKTFKDEDHAARLSALSALRAQQTVPAAAAVPRVEAPAMPPAAAQAAMPPAADDRPPDARPGAIALDVEPDAMSLPPTRRAPGGAVAMFTSPRGRLGLAAAGVLVAILLIAWFWGRSRTDTDSTAPPSAVPAAQSSPASAPQSAPTPVASTGTPRAVNIVLMTSRPVWTRVTVDDRKVIERELPGGQTIPLGADRTIAIRAGDAGAIRLVVEGKDAGVLGRDGQIASRTFSAPAAR